MISNPISATCSGGKPLDGRLCADRHENRRSHGAMCSRQNPRAFASRGTLTGRFENSHVSCLEDQHGIAKAEETVSLTDRLMICFPHELHAHICPNEHQQGRFREMKVREQMVESAELMRRIDEDAGLSAACSDGPVRVDA